MNFHFGVGFYSPGLNCFSCVWQVEHLAGRHVIQVFSHQLQRLRRALSGSDCLMSNRWRVVRTTAWLWFTVYLLRTAAPPK